MYFQPMNWAVDDNLPLLLTKGLQSGNFFRTWRKGEIAFVTLCHFQLIFSPGVTGVTTSCQQLEADPGLTCMQQGSNASAATACMGGLSVQATSSPTSDPHCRSCSCPFTSETCRCSPTIFLCVWEKGPGPKADQSQVRLRQL